LPRGFMMSLPIPSTCGVWSAHGPGRENPGDHGNPREANLWGCPCGFLGKSIVRAREEDDAELLRVRLQFGEHPPADGLHLGEAVELPLPAMAKAVRAASGSSHVSGGFQQRLFGALDAARQIQQRCQQAAAALPETIERRAEGGLEIVSLALNQGQTWTAGCCRPSGWEPLEVRQEDEIRRDSALRRCRKIRGPAPPDSRRRRRAGRCPPGG